MIGGGPAHRVPARRRIRSGYPGHAGLPKRMRSVYPPAIDCLGRSVMYKRIVLAYDGSDAGQKALLDCRDLAQWSQADLHLIAVMPSAMSFVGLEGGVY